MIPGFSAAESIVRYLPMPPQLLPVLLCAVMLLILALQKLVRRPRQPSPTSQGSATWSTRRALQRTGAYNQQGMYLGYAHGDYVRSPREMSVVIFGPPGKGKSWTHFDTTLVACDDVDILCVDQSGDLVDHTATHRSTLGPVYILDLNDPISPDQFNFRDLIRWNTPQAFGDCQRQAEHIVRPREASGSRGAQHYDRVATALIPLSMRYLYEVKPAWTYEDLLDLYSTPGQTAQKIMREMAKSSSKTLQRGAARLANETPQRLRDDWSAAAEWFTLWEDPVLARNTSHTTIPWRAFQQGPKDVRHTLYIRISSTDAIGRHQPVFRLLIDQLLFLSTDRRSIDYTRLLYVLIDDARFLGDLLAPEVIAANYRKYGIRIMLSYQSPSQLWDLHGRYGTGLLNACGCWVIYPQYEPDSAEYLAKKCGDATVLEPMDRVSAKGLLGKTYSTALQARQRKLITAEEIMSLRGEQIIICVDTEKVIGQRINSRRSKPFKRRLTV